MVFAEDPPFLATGSGGGWSSRVHNVEEFPGETTTMKNLFLALYLSSCLWLMSGCGGGGGTPPPPPPPSLVITTSTLPSGSEGSTYGDSGLALSASGGRAPYTWKWAPAPGSSLPVGLSLSTGGMISGVPTVAGTYSVVVTVADSESPAAQVSASYPITIEGVVHLSITSGDPPSGKVGVDYGPSTTQYLSCIWSPVLGWHQVCTPCSRPQSCLLLPRCRGAMNVKPCLRTQEVFLGFTFTAVGGAAPYQWTASGLPAGLTLDGSSGRLKGTPTSSGSFSTTVKVTDSASPQGEASGNYNIEIVE